MDLESYNKTNIVDNPSSIACFVLFVMYVNIVYVIVEDIREDWTCPTEPPL